MALATFLQRLRSTSPQEQHAQHLYRTEAQQFVTRVQTIFDEWLSLREIESDNGALANAAAVSRWELMRMARSLEHLSPPRSLSGVHRAVQSALLTSARACQLLANGYRGHKAEVVCDGQALLLDMVAEINGLRGRLQMHA
ncbi:MAG: hypothetical protein JOZ87_21770 [Chloroflexi bacterium]|nr:hypothetical protein [Chloroflexota bacterium]